MVEAVIVIALREMIGNGRCRWQKIHNQIVSTVFFLLLIFVFAIKIHCSFFCCPGWRCKSANTPHLMFYVKRLRDLYLELTVVTPLHHFCSYLHICIYSVISLEVNVWSRVSPLYLVFPSSVKCKFTLIYLQPWLCWLLCFRLSFDESYLRLFVCVCLFLCSVHLL